MHYKYIFGLLIVVLLGIPVRGCAQVPGGTGTWETVVDSTSFTSEKSFLASWNLFYPWGTDHNGSARMYKKQIKVKKGVLTLSANRVNKPEGKSGSVPYLDIRYKSGAVHAKHQINVTKQFPQYWVSGEFKAPVAKGTWPAFWLTAVNGWPPESDILEFKGDSVNWQNTFLTPKNVMTIKQHVPHALEEWHTYAALLTRVDDNNITITYYFDGKEQATHTGNFTGKPMWLIINMQMEGSSGSPGPDNETKYFARRVNVKRLKAQ